MIVYIIIALILTPVAIVLIKQLLKEKNINFGEHTAIRTSLGFLIFTVFLFLSFFIFPVIAMAAQDILPRWISFPFFFWYQLVIPRGFMNGPIGLNHLYHYYFFGQVIYFAIPFWMLVGFVYAWFTRKFKLRYVISLVYPTMFLLILCIYTTLSLFGLEPMLEGP
jgi:hypothetical protein